MFLLILFLGPSADKINGKINFAVPLRNLNCECQESIAIYSCIGIVNAKIYGTLKFFLNCESQGLLQFVSSHVLDAAPHGPNGSIQCYST